MKKLDRRGLLAFVIFITIGFCARVDAQILIPGELTSDELTEQRLYIEAAQAKLIGANDDAIRIYKEILQRDPQNHAAAYEYSRALYAQEKYREALAQIEVALKYGPDNPWYWVMKGDILEVLEDYAAAIDVYDELTKLRPAEEYYYLHEVDLLLKTRQEIRALEVLNTVERELGPTPDIIRQKVNVLDALGRPADAVAELDKILEFYPTELEFLHLAALYAIEAKMDDRTRELYDRILEIDPDDAAANLYAASQFKSAGEDIGYLESIIPLMQNPSIDIDAKITELIPYVESYVESPTREYALTLDKVISELVKYHPDEAKAHALYGDFLYSSGMLPDAVEEYEKTLTLDKSVFDVWEQLMYIKAEMYDMDGLLRTSEQALDVFPNQASIFYLRGLALAYKDDHDEALGELQQALIMSGRNKELKFHVYHLLGQVYLESGDRTKAYEAFDKALEIQPENVALLTQYSNSLVRHMEFYGKAENLAKKALDLSPGNPQIEHTLALISYGRNDIKKAFEYIDAAMEHGGGDDPTILEHYGDILYSMDKVDEAVEYWQLSLDGGNQSPNLKKKIAERKIIH